MSESQRSGDGVDWRVKEAIMNLVGNLVDELRPYPNLMTMIEPLMIYHVLPELTSPEPYLRMRAIWFYGQFENLTITDLNHIKNAMDGIFHGLQDRNLPVRFYAATTIYKLLKNNEFA